MCALKQKTIHHATVGSRGQKQAEESRLAVRQSPIVQKRSSNRGGGSPLPHSLQSFYEQKTGLPMNDVRVHYNSEKPAQFQALAYTKGSDIYLGSNQERHLPHEIGHVIQQKTMRIPVTGHKNGEPINESADLERAADLTAEISYVPPLSSPSATVQFVRDFTVHPAGGGNHRIVYRGNRQSAGMSVCHNFTAAAIRHIAPEHDTIAGLRWRELSTTLHAHAPNNFDPIITRNYRYLISQYIDAATGAITAGGAAAGMSRVTQANCAVLHYPSLLFFLQIPGANLHHTMIASNANEWLGSNNINSMGQTGSEDSLYPQRFVNVSTRTPTAHTKGGWSGELFTAATGAQYHIYALPIPVSPDVVTGGCNIL